jgi:hypothetical protein
VAWARAAAESRGRAMARASHARRVVRMVMG